MDIIKGPPDCLDGAKVLQWAWAGEEPFGFVNNKDNSEREEISGLALCKYDNGEGVYRFSCNKDWEVVQDSLYDTIEKAIKQLPNQYKKIKADWQTK